MKKKNKNKKKKFNGYKFVGSLLIISSCILLGIILYINILPIKYLGILSGIILLINLIVNFFLFRKKIKKKPKKIFTVISLIFTFIFVIASFFIYKTFGILDNMSEEYKTYTYHVLVKSDSSYNKVEDLTGKTIGYYNNNSNATKKALSILEKKITLKSDGFGNLDGLGVGLLNSEVDAIMVEDSQKGMLYMQGNISDSTLNGFADKVKILYTFKVKVKIEADGVNVTKDPFNIYISGMDQYGTVSEISRSDVNMVVTVNPKTKQILLTNIPRDYFVQIHDTTGYKDKLTHAGNYGIETSEKTIEDLLGIEINYYFKVNFSSLVNIIDALGGVEVYSEYDFQSYNGYNFSKGYNSVDGKAGLSFVRERKTFADGDNQRGKNQQAMIEAIFRKCTSPAIITKYNSLLNSLKDSMLTNMPMKSITKLAKMQLRDNSSWTITSNSLTGTGSYDYTYTYPYQELYVMVPDEESVTEGKEMINKVASGETLESSYNGDTSDVHSVTKSSVQKSSSYTNTNKTTTKKTNTNKTKKPSTTNKDNVLTVPEEDTDNQDAIVTEPEVDEDINQDDTTQDSDGQNTNPSVPQEPEVEGEINQTEQPLPESVPEKQE